MMEMKTDWIQSVCSFMWYNEIMNWWGPVPVKPMEEVIYQVNCIAVSTTTDTLLWICNSSGGGLSQSRSLR